MVLVDSRTECPEGVDGVRSESVRYRRDCAEPKPDEREDRAVRSVSLSVSSTASNGPFMDQGYDVDGSSIGLFGDGSGVEPCCASLSRCAHSSSKRAICWVSRWCIDRTTCASSVRVIGCGRSVSSWSSSTTLRRYCRICSVKCSK